MTREQTPGGWEFQRKVHQGKCPARGRAGSLWFPWAERGIEWVREAGSAGDEFGSTDVSNPVRERNEGIKYH